MDRMVRYGSPPLSISWVKEWGPALATIRCYSFTRVGTTPPRRGPYPGE